jgi:hypothetical protein
MTSGGVVFAAWKVVHGRAIIARLFLTVKRRRGERFTWRRSR